MNPSFTTADYIRTVSTVAENYGFQPLQHIIKDAECKNCTRPLPHTVTAKDCKKDNLHGLLAGGTATYCESSLYALERPVFTYDITSVPRSGDIAVSYHIFNVEKSIGEALLIQSLRSLVTELGYIDYSIRINSLGDNESITRYHRELANFLRKRIDYLPPAARELMKEHVMLALLHLIEKEHELAHKSPSPLEFLSDFSRKHFREIIEYLDISDAPYEIDPKLIGHHDCYSDALFSIEVQDENYPNQSNLQIRGGRYDNFMHKHTGNKVSATGAVAILQNRKTPARVSRPRLPVPSVYIVHLGFGPKIRTLLLIDQLRNAGIPVIQNVASDSLSEQLRDAEMKECPYTLIIGQKEFVEGSVILRDMRARNQETIPLDQVVRKLKRATASVS